MKTSFTYHEGILFLVQEIYKKKVEILNGKSDEKLSPSKRCAQYKKQKQKKTHQYDLREGGIEGGGSRKGHQGGGIQEGVKEGLRRETTWKA